MKEKQSFEYIPYAVAGFGPPAFFGIATVLGLVRTGYDPIVAPISALAVGPQGWMQGLNFAVLASSFLAFAVVLRKQFSMGSSFVAGPLVFVVMTLGVTIAGLFPMDAPDAPPTLSGHLHTLGGFLVFPWMPIGLFVVARRFRRERGWQSYFMFTVATGILSFATIVFFLLFVGPPGTTLPLSSFRGLVQRVQLVPFFTWMAFVARKAYRASDERSVRELTQAFM
jgi:hypothetical protein